MTYLDDLDPTPDEYKQPTEPDFDGLRPLDITFGVMAAIVAVLLVAVVLGA